MTALLQSIKILHVEDVRSDAELVKRAIQKSQLNFEWQWVSTKSGFTAALEEFAPNIILCDHTLPGFTSVEAIKIMKDAGMNIPFILITGTISEDFAVMMMKEGISDYLLKDRIQRLPVAITHALEKRQAEKEKEMHLEEISRNEKRFRALIENNFDAITLRDENLSVIYRSPSAKKMVGYDDHETIDDAFYETVHPDDLGNVKKFFQLALENPGKSYHLTVRAMHRAGHYIWVEGVMRNMLMNESVKGIIFNYRDISERKESELQHERMTADILQRNKSLEQFTYIISHNLRAPVANLLGISNIIEYPCLEEDEKKKLLAGICSSARKLDEVIIDLNKVLQKKEQNITESKQMVCFQLVVDDIHSSISHLIESNHVKIITDFKALTGMHSIKSYLCSIFYNLISNSIKYRRPGISPVIEVESFKTGNKMGLIFRDNGIGIDLSIHGSKVFGLYKRFHPETEGKGMGLFMVKTQVEALDGTITISSEVNKGTEFTITL
jgi:PAS domain S-box-containing protein